MATYTLKVTCTSPLAVTALDGLNMSQASALVNMLTRSSYLLTVAGMVPGQSETFMTDTLTITVTRV